MLNSVLMDAIKNRDQTLSILKGPKFDQIIQKAKDNWIEHTPQKENVISAGIDSSFNSTKFQGAELWAVTAVSVKSDGELLVDLHEFGLDINPQLASHGGRIDVVRVENGILFIEMQGGGQGCSSSKYTLQSGVEQKIKEKFPEIISIQDITDHDAGENPYYE